MTTYISITIFTVFFHAICTDTKITYKTMKHFPIVNNTFVKKAMSLFCYIHFVYVLQSMVMNRLIVMYQ